MKYEDTNTTINGIVKPIRVGTPMQDGANPTDDGYDHIRGIQHFGSVIQDSKGEKLNPKS